jgi:hypothetical protein
MLLLLELLVERTAPEEAVRSVSGSARQLTRTPETSRPILAVAIDNVLTARWWSLTRF